MVIISAICYWIHNVKYVNYNSNNKKYIGREVKVESLEILFKLSCCQFKQAIIRHYVCLMVTTKVKPVAKHGKEVKA